MVATVDAKALVGKHLVSGFAEWLAWKIYQSNSRSMGSWHWLLWCRACRYRRLENVSWLAFAGALVAAFAVMTSTVSQEQTLERVLAANEKLAEQADQIAKLVNGGDNFAYLTFQVGLRPRSSN